MKRISLSRSVAVILATAAPLVLVNGSEPLAKKPAGDVDCMVGTAAYPTIQSAVDKTSADGTPVCQTIGVPAGTFRENVKINPNYPQGIITHSKVTIRGAGAKHTTVDGSGDKAPVFLIGGRRASPCGEPEVAVTLENMTITGGSVPVDANVPNPNQRNGGGVQGSPGVKLTVNDCIVTSNSADMNGGGLSVANGRLTVLDSVISDNTACRNPPAGAVCGGGGLRIAGCPAILMIRDSVLKGNVSLRKGGGAFINGSVAPIAGVALPIATAFVADTEIKHNTAGEALGGGGIYYNYTDLTVLDSKIEHNYPDDVTAGAMP